MERLTRPNIALTFARCGAVFDVFVEPLRPKEDAGLFRQEECRQLPSGLFLPYFLQERGPSLLQEPVWAAGETADQRQGDSAQQTPPEDGQVQAQRQPVQSEMSDHGEQEREDGEVVRFPPQDSVQQQLQLVMRVRQV